MHKDASMNLWVYLSMRYTSITGISKIMDNSNASSGIIRDENSNLSGIK